jgi:diguanylate cyclase (GGDEF)-like protein
MRQTLRPELVSKCLEMVYAQAVTAYTASIVAALFLGALFWNMASTEVIVGWMVAYVVLVVLRHQVYVRFRLQVPGAQSSGRWLRWFELGLLATGVMWGLFSVYLAQHGDPHRLAVVVITLGALVSGAVWAYGVFPSAFLAFSAPAMAPIGVYLIAQGTYGDLLLGLIVLTWLWFMFQGARRFRAFAIESLNFQFENMALMGDLAEQRDKAEELAAQLKALSSLDGLTGVPNRRHFDGEVAHAWDAALRAGHPMSLILCDLDCFKLYNDTYGHPQGDECLRQAASVLSRIAKDGAGTAARFGGEEFAVVLPQGDRTAALGVAERMRSAVEGLRLPHRSSTVGPVVTGTFGVATAMPTPSLSMQTLVETADRALYEAKNAGRNRVIGRQLE